MRWAPIQIWPAISPGWPPRSPARHRRSTGRWASTRARCRAGICSGRDRRSIVELRRQLGALRASVAQAQARSEGDATLLRAELATLLSFAKTLAADSITWRADFAAGLRELERREAAARAQRERLTGRARGPDLKARRAAGQHRPRGEADRGRDRRRVSADGSLHCARRARDGRLAVGAVPAKWAAVREALAGDARRRRRRRPGAGQALLRIGGPVASVRHSSADSPRSRRLAARIRQAGSRPTAGSRRRAPRAAASGPVHRFARSATARRRPTRNWSSAAR